MTSKHTMHMDRRQEQYRRPWLAVLLSAALLQAGLGCGRKGETAAVKADAPLTESIREAREALNRTGKRLSQQAVSCGEACLARADAHRQSGDELRAVAYEEAALACYRDAKEVAATVARRRKLSFPKEWAGGEILVREWDFAGTWQKVGPAQEVVKVEKEQMVQFAASREFEDSDMETLLRLPPGSIQYLNLGEARQVSDAAMEVVGRMKGLWDLSLFRAQVTDEGLRHLKKLPYLRQLNLLDTRVTPDCLLELLPMLPGLADLALRGDAVDDKGLFALRGCPKLERLFCLYEEGTVTDVGVDHLSELSGLRCLWLNGRQITDHSVPLLARHEGLEDVFLMSTSITEAGAQELARALPECDVNVKAMVD